MKPVTKSQELGLAIGQNRDSHNGFDIPPVHRPQ